MEVRKELDMLKVILFILIFSMFIVVGYFYDKREEVKGRELTDKKNLNEKKEKVCYLVETKDRRYLEFVDKKNLETTKAKWREQEGFLSARELSKEEFKKYEENNFEGLGEKK